MYEKKEEKEAERKNAPTSSSMYTHPFFLIYMEVDSQKSEILAVVVHSTLSPSLSLYLYMLYNTLLC